MLSILPLTKLALVFLTIFGFYGTWYLVFNNGTIDLLSKAEETGILPGTNQPLRTHYTGIPWLDHRLTTLVIFFWEQVDGSNPTASLFCYHFATQTFSGWALIAIESLRRGNRGRLVSFQGLWGLAIQTFAYAVVGPIVLLLHLFTSPTVTEPTPKDLVVDREDVLSVLPAMLVGYMLPTVLMSLPAPSVIGFDSKQIFVAGWQCFPLWVSLAQQGFSPLIGYLSPGRAGQGREKTHPMKYLRILYLMLLIVSFLSQLSTLQFVATSHFFPGLFAEEYRGVWHFSNVFMPKAISPAMKMSSIGSGTLLLLQYDEIVAHVSLRLWALALLFGLVRQQSLKVSEHKMAALGLGLLAVVLPMGSVVTVMWIRDEMVFRGNADEKRKA